MQQVCRTRGGNDLVDSFDEGYAGADLLWTGAPSDPLPYTLFSGSKTYERPGIAYIAGVTLGEDRSVIVLERNQLPTTGAVRLEVVDGR